MRAIDTNILIRLLTADDPVQAQTARQVVEADDIFVGATVLLETEWVLRAAYGFGADAIAQALRNLAGLPGITIENPAAVALALDAMAAGMDFADALHLARAQHCTAFVTFDRKLAARAKDSPIPVVVL